VLSSLRPRNFRFLSKFDFTLDCCLGIPEVVKNVVEDICGKIEDVDRSYLVAGKFHCPVLRRCIDCLRRGIIHYTTIVNEVWLA